MCQCVNFDSSNFTEIIIAQTMKQAQKVIFKLAISTNHPQGIPRTLMISKLDTNVLNGTI